MWFVLRVNDRTDPHLADFIYAKKNQQPVQLNKAIITLHSGKAATDKMLQIIEAHPNWLMYAGVFEHPSPRLTYRHPIWSDMTSVDTAAQ